MFKRTFIPAKAGAIWGLRAVVDTLFPPGCWADEEAMGMGGLSEKVRREIGVLAAQNYCRRCGLTVGPFARNDWRNRCHRCGQRNAGVKRTARVGTFSEPLITLVHRLKFGRSWEVAEVLAPFLHHAIEQVATESGVGVDYLVPVSLHWTRRAQRGFNQAEELARKVAVLGGWQVRCALRRVRRTAEQARIDTPTRRAENLKDAFVCRKDAWRGALADKHLWLIDDVSTTGATLRAAAMAIVKLPKEMRPASLNAAVVCVTDHGSPPAEAEVVG
ncbi:MAG: hypothetical protein FWD53_00060 [Phycisphaerales bacterium]|nr:hypothetical protein [Phycisphaerales bacterium]